MRDALFRSQVNESISNKIFGNVLIPMPFKANALIAVFLAMFFAAFLFIAIGDYGRKEKAFGVLSADRGAAKIIGQSKGSISRILVKEGEGVKPGQALFTVEGERHNVSGVEIGSEKVEDLRKLLELAEARLSALPARQQEEKNALNAELSNIESTIQGLDAQHKIAIERLRIKEDRQKRIERLSEKNIISKDELQANYDALLQMRGGLQNILAERNTASSHYASLEARVSTLDSVFADQNQGLESEVSELKRRLIDARAQQSLEIVSPIEGRVTNIQAFSGMPIDQVKPLAYIVPKGSKLYALLFVPSKAMGFIATDQSVLLQYPAFPFQKYGAQLGKIESIGKSVMKANEIEAIDLSAIANYGPFIRITVRLDQDRFYAFGKELPLQAGMLVNADIMLEKRSIVEWMLEPLYRAKVKE